MTEATAAAADPVIRREVETDHADVRDVVYRAFDSSEEADLVDVLRAQARPLVSIVADAGRVVGHVMCSPVTLAAYPDVPLMALAPVAVLPEWQRRGVGSALVRAAIDACMELGSAGLIVLGHPEYYPRFGFVPASRFGLRCPYEAPDEAFMALELVPAALADADGIVIYHAAFPPA